MADTDTTAQPVLDLDALLASRTLLMVGGKGGVGKTTTASALAIRAADQGRKVLLVSTDPAHSLADAFNRPIGNSPTCLAPGLTALELDPDDEGSAPRCAALPLQINSASWTSSYASAVSPPVRRKRRCWSASRG